MKKLLNPVFANGRLSPVGVALLYAAFATLWIAASGSLLKITVKDVVLQSQLEQLKGLLFVVVTSGLLYLALRQWQSPLGAESESSHPGVPKPKKLRWRALSLIIFVAMAPLAGHVVVRIHGPQIEQEAYANLEAIAQLKTNQVESWLDERYNDGVVIMTNPGFVSQVEALQNAGGSRVQNDAHAMLGTVIEALQYDKALLVTTLGKPLIDIGAFGPFSQEAKELLPQVLASSLPQHTQIFSDADGHSQIEFVVPLIQYGNALPHPVGAVILRVSPEHFLFPYIQNWPTASSSGESLLVRRVGDFVLLMNDGREAKGNKSPSWFSLEKVDLPSAIAVKKTKSGRVEGVDFRGVPVLAAYRPVGETDWVVLAKLDRQEVMAPLRNLAFWVSLMALLAISAVSGVMLVLWQQRGRALRLEMQAESDALLRQFYDLPFIGIAIGSLHNNQCLKCNDYLCQILGYSREELIGMGWEDLTHPEDKEASRFELDRVLRGESDAYVLDKRFVRKDGTAIYTSVDVKCVRAVNGTGDYLIAAVQDITASRRAEAQIRRLSRIYATLSECNQAIVRCSSQEELFPLVCRIAVQLGGMKIAWVALLDPKTHWARAEASYGEGAETVRDIRFSIDAEDPFGQGAVGPALREGSPVWINGYLNDPRSLVWHEQASREGWGSVAGLPLTCEGQVIGAFALVSGEPQAFDEEIRKLLVEMAGDISFALGLFAREARRSLMEEALRESESRFRNLYEKAPLAYQSLDVEGNILEVNEAWLVLLGRSRDEVIGRFIGDFLTDIGVQTLSCEFPQFRQSGRVDGPLFQFVHKDGSLRLLMVNGQIARDSEGNFQRTHCILTDLTEIHRNEEQLKLAAKVFEQSAEGIIITDASNVILMVNQAFSSITGYSAAEVLGQNPGMMFSGCHDRSFYQDMWESIHSAGYWHGEIWNRRKDGDIFPEMVSISQVVDTDNQVSHYVGIFSDISERKASEAHIHRLAHFDALTGLPNRILLADRVGQALSRMERNSEPLALVFLDLDRFKNVNDSLGHRIGDELLIQVAERLKALLREEDTVSRLGGDEFILVLPEASAEGAAHVAEKILAVLSTPYRIEQHELTITPSLGIAMYPGDGSSYETLSMCADAAMYRAKQAGRNTFCFFTREMQERSERTLQLENALRRVLANHELQLHFQPQMSLETNRIIGAEALLRWKHPEFGMVAPGDFIPIAEDCGLILPIGEWVLRTAVRQMSEWMKSGLTSMAVAVNLSAIQFRRADLPELVSSVLDEFGLPPECLELELTEGVAMENPLAAIEMMNLLHARGIRMSIDDFGTGYSSLSYLKRFKVYKLKIDQSFVRDISCDPEDEAIVDAIIGMSKSLGLQTIAEGVETAEQLAFLRSKGCNEVQGYFFAKPMPAEEFEAFVRAYRP